MRRKQKGFSWGRVASLVHFREGEASWRKFRGGSNEGSSGVKLGRRASRGKFRGGFSEGWQYGLVGEL